MPQINNTGTPVNHFILTLSFQANTQPTLLLRLTNIFHVQFRITKLGLLIPNLVYRYLYIYERRMMKISLNYIHVPLN